MNVNTKHKKKELGRLSKLAPKTKINGSHEKVRTTQH
jgi:hypothetical protein